MKDFKEEQILMHPLCHLFNGERIYYFLLSIERDIESISNEILHLLDESGIEKSSCGHVIFGVSDIILRVWASEDKISELREAFKRRSFIKKYREFLVDRLSTWYQRELEQNSNWQEKLYCIRDIFMWLFLFICFCLL